MRTGDEYLELIGKWNFLQFRAASSFSSANKKMIPFKPPPSFFFLFSDPSRHLGVWKIFVNNISTIAGVAKICSCIFFIYENANALHIWSFLFPIVGKFVTWSWHGYGSYFFNGANKWRVQVWQFCIWSSRCTCFLLEESRPWLLKIKIIEHYFDWWGKDRWRRKTYLFTPPGSIWDANMITFHGLRTRLQSVFSSQPWWVQILSWVQIFSEH